LVCLECECFFLPHNTIPTLQPLHQEGIATFKVYYMWRVFSKLIKETAGEDKQTLNKFWHKFNMLHGIGIMRLSWNKITWLKASNGILNHFIANYKILSIWNIAAAAIHLQQCCSTFPHSWHTKYCRRVMAAHHNPILHVVGGGGGVYGIDLPRQLPIKQTQTKNVLFDVHNYPSLLLCHLF
jgi:hypothetical protein